MKKLSIILVALVAVFAVACKKSSPVDTIVKMMNDYTEKISKAASLEDVMKIGQDMEKEYGEFAEKAVKEFGEDYKPSADEQKLVDEAQAKFEAAMQEAVKKFTPAEAAEEETESEEAEAEEETPAEGEAEAPAEEAEAPAEGE